MTGTRRLALALLAAVLVCARPLCAGALPFSSATWPASGSGIGVELLGRGDVVASFSTIRFYPCARQSSESSCGSASLANLLNVFFGHAADESPVQSASGTELASGSSLYSLLDSVRRLGFTARAYKMDVSLLRTVLTEIGIPVIGLYDTPTAHYVIAVAPVRGRVLIFDPASGFSVLSEAQLCRRWSGYSLVVDPGTESLDKCRAVTAAFASRFEDRHRRLEELGRITTLITPITPWVGQ